MLNPMQNQKPELTPSIDIACARCGKRDEQTFLTEYNDEGAPYYVLPEGWHEHYPPGKMKWWWKPKLLCATCEGEYQKAEEAAWCNFWKEEEGDGEEEADGE